MEPRKWKKYKLLVDFGIIREQYLENCILRYPIDDYLQCLNDIENELANPEYSGNQVVLVSQNETNSLPFFWTRTNHEISEAQEWILKINKAKYSEIWHRRCRKEDIFCNGRQMFPINNLYPRIASSVVELVSKNSGRIIEQYPDVPDGYVRLVKKDRPYPFEIEDIFIKTPVGEALVENAETIGQKLNFMQKRFIDFGQFIKSLECNCVSFDFFFADNKIVVYDWDCNNDKKALSRIEALNL